MQTLSSIQSIRRRPNLYLGPRDGVPLANLALREAFCLSRDAASRVVVRGGRSRATGAPENLHCSSVQPSFEARTAQRSADAISKRLGDGKFRARTQS